MAKHDMPCEPTPSDYLDYIRRFECIICEAPAEAAHVRYGDWSNYAKVSSGLSKKPDDCWAIPLCPNHHRLTNEAQHKGNERRFWERHGIDPLLYCVLLRHAYPDPEAAIWAFPRPIRPQYQSKPRKGDT